MRRLKLANGVEIELATKGERFFGLGEVRVQGVQLRSGIRPIRPVLATMDGIAFTDFRAPEISQRGTTVIIRAKAIGRWQSATDDMVSHWWPVRTGMDYMAQDQEFAGIMEWIIEPENIEADGTTFVGFITRYRFRGPKGKYVCRMEEQSTWELEGSTRNNTLIERCYYTPEKHEVDLARSVAYSTGGRAKREGFGGWAFQYSLRWGGSIAPFDFLFNKSGALIRGFRKPSFIRSWLHKPAGEERLGCFDEHFFEASDRIETVGTYVGFAAAPKNWTRTAARNLWTAVMDYYTEQACRFAGTRPFPILPMMTLPNGRNHPFRQTADTLIEPAAKLGFKVVWLHPIWDSEMNRPGGYGNGCSVYDWKVAEELGGEEGLKYLADKAHQHGLMLIAWCGGIRQGIESNPWTRAHLSWISRYINGRQFGSGYDCMCGLDVNRDDAYRYVIETCRGVIERTGLDGFFWDSYVDAWLEVVSPWDLKMKPAFERVAQMTAELQKICRYFVVEAQGVWSRPVVGNGIAGPSVLEGCQYANYGRFFGDFDPNRPDILDFYFRNLAYGAGSVMGCEFLDKVLANRSLAEGLTRVNTDYMAVREYMGKRRLLEGDPGVEWTSADGQHMVFFAFRDGRYQPGQRFTEVKCVTKGEPVPPRRDGSLDVSAGNTYLLRLASND